MHLKGLTSVLPDIGITQTILSDCEKVGVDVYGSFRGVPGVYSTGGNKFFDDVYNAMWFKSALEVGLFNYLKQTNTKVPQDEAGMLGLKNACGLVCRRAVLNAYVASGNWGETSPTFGDPETFRKNIADFGFYIWSEAIEDQSQSEREQRKAPVTQIALKVAGAIHSIDAIVTIQE